MTANCIPPTASPAPLPGWVVTTYRHYKGKKLGPYYFRKWKVNGKIRKQYIKPADVERIKAACLNNRERRQRIQMAGYLANCGIRNFRLLCHIQTRLDRNQTIRPDLVRHLQRIIDHGPEVPGCPPLRRPRVFGVPLLSKDVLEKLRAILESGLAKQSTEPKDVLEPSRAEKTTSEAPTETVKRSFGDPPVAKSIIEELRAFRPSTFAGRSSETKHLSEQSCADKTSLAEPMQGAERNFGVPPVAKSIFDELRAIGASRSAAHWRFDH